MHKPEFQYKVKMSILSLSGEVGLLVQLMQCSFAEQGEFWLFHLWVMDIYLHSSSMEGPQRSGHKQMPPDLVKCDADTQAREHA